MSQDMCVPCDGGIINIRVGAIILKGEKFLMVRNSQTDYYYSVGGRLQFHETAEEAVIREVCEETGVRMEVDHLGFVLEDYFIADTPRRIGKEYYELSFFFYMKTPEDFEPVCRSFTEDNQKEYLEWVSPDEKRTMYPAFFRTDLDIHDRSVRHMTCDDRFYIRRMTPEDLEPLHTLLSDPEVMKYLEPPFTLPQTKAFLETQGLIPSPRVFAAEDRNHRFTGYVIYHDFDEENMEIGWVLKKEYWGSGMAGLLTRQLIVKAASEGKGAVIECVPEQEAAKKIAGMQGFERVGTRDGLEVYHRKCPGGVKKPSKEVLVREASAQDAAGIASLCFDEMDYNCTEELVREKMQNLQADREKVFAAVSGDQVAGFIHVEKYQLLYAEPMANILGLAVRRDRQRQGIGTALIQAAEDWARKQNIKTMRLTSGDERIGAHAFYRAQGYRAGKEQLRLLKDLMPHIRMDQ